MRIRAVLSVDTSGSMKGKKLSDSKQALIDFTDQLPTGAEVGIVGFSGYGARVIQAPTAKADQVKSSLNKLSAGGNTPMFAGLEKSHDRIGSPQVGPHPDALTVKGSGRRDRFRRAIVLSSDGAANKGPTGEKIIELGERIKKDGVELITISIGKNADDKLLNRLASGEENYHKATFSGQLPDLYREIATSITPKG